MTSHQDGLREALDARAPVVFLPVYGYSHSGVTIRTTPFACEWDSWLAGYVYLTQTDLDEIHGEARLSLGADQPDAAPGVCETPAGRQVAEDLLRAAVIQWDQYIQGLVRCATAYDAQGRRVDSLHGIYGDEAHARLVAGDMWGLDPACITVDE